jgi:hypothetical protein
LKSVIEIGYIHPDANEGVVRTWRPDGHKPGPEEDHPMTIEILYLTVQIQRWINERVARHLAAQAAKLDH